MDAVHDGSGKKNTISAATDVIQNIFKGKVESFYKQLMNGCGNESCQNAFCKSNPGLRHFTLTPNEAGPLALKLAQSGNLEWVCSTGGNHATLSAPVPLTEEALDELLNHSSPTASPSSSPHAPLIRYLGANLGSPDVLRVSFLKSPLLTEVDGDSGVDLAACRRFWEKLWTPQTPIEIKNVISSSLSRLIGSLENEPKTSSLTYLRPFLFIWAHPAPGAPYLHPTTSSFVTLLFKLPSASLTSFRTQIAKEKSLDLGALVDSWQRFLSVRALLSSSHLLNEDASVTGGTQILGWLHDINRKTTPSLSLHAFYNPVINDNLTIEDFLAWKRMRPGLPKFSFAAHAYVLNPEQKSRIMNIESIISQRLHQEMAMNHLAQGMVDLPYLVFKVRRSHLISDSIGNLAAIKIANPNDLKKQLKVEFEGEEGIDEGGVQKEWFQLLVAELFSLKYGMFTQDEATRFHWFNQRSQDLPEFELLGTVLGLALYNNVLLDLHFPLLVYRCLLTPSYTPTLQDLAEINSDLAHGLEQLLSSPPDLVPDLDLNFVVSYDYYGARETYELLPGGASIPVTAENRDDYVSRYVSYLLKDSISTQFEAFKKGFTLVCSGDAVRLLAPEELQLLICGSPDLDFVELEQHTLYDNGYDKNHPTIRAFWEIVHALSPEDKRRLLAFATGSDRSPIGGLGKLQFVITQTPDSDRLPTAHTCFNHFILPSYPTKEKLKRLLLIALQHSHGFGTR